MVYMLVHHNCNFISLFHIVVKIRLFDKKKAVVDGVAEKDPGKRFRNNTLYAQCFNNLRCLLSGGTAAEVLSCYNNVTFLDLSCQLRVLFLVATTKDSNSFRVMRVLVWLQPEKYSDEGGYQTLQALYAIGSGGFFGRGLGNSIQKLGSVPEAQNDMIFSIICEELGVFGGIFVLILFGYLLYRLFFIAQNAPDLFGSLIVTGIFIHIALQVILNIAVVLNLMPNTGVTLPFISYGGTSIVFLMSEMAIALSVARQIKFQE